MSEIELTDLRSITRDSDKCRTTIWFMDRWERNRIKWLILGECHLRHEDRWGFPSRWTLHAWLRDGATDFEHDSVYALKLPLVAVEFGGTEHQHTSIFGYVDSEQGEGGFSQFHVPRPGYDPFKVEGVVDCPDCRERLKNGEGEVVEHKIIPEGHFIPPFDPDMYEKVKGKPVMIEIGPSPDLWKTQSTCPDCGSEMVQTPEEVKGKLGEFVCINCGKFDIKNVEVQVDGPEIKVVATVTREE